MSTWMGRAVPLNGESQIYQLTAANDILTLTKVTSGTGDFLVLENNSGTELVVIESDGDVNIAAGAYLNLGSTVTTAPTTGLTKGDLFVAFSTSSPVLGICTSTAANTVKYLSPFDTKTLGRVS